MIACHLDHCALAVERYADVLPRYVDELGGTFLEGGPEDGFIWQQYVYANGMRLELLEPNRVEHFDFLRRFLDRNGPGPHHLTFKCQDIEAAIAEATAAGYEAVNVHLDDPNWKEAFLHPKSAPGIVVQLAWSHHDMGHAHTGATAFSFDRVVHAVADLDDGLAIFERLLGGQRIDEGKDDDATFVELAWPGPGRLRLVQPAVAGDGRIGSWLGDRRGRLHHLAFSGPVANEVVTEPEHNFGTRLVISPGES